MAVKLQRNRLVGMFQELGYTHPERWNDDDFAEELKDLPKRMNSDDKSYRVEEPDEWSAESRDTFNDVLEAMDKEDSILIVKEDQEKTNGHGKGNGKKKVKPKKEETKKEIPPAEEFDLETGDAVQSKRGRGRPKGVKREPVVDDTIPHQGFNFKEVEKPKAFKLNKALAVKFRDMTPFPRDRDYSEARANRIRLAALNKEFRGTEWISCKNEETGNVYRLNGNHTSKVLASLLEKGEEVDCYIVVREYSCPTMEDMAGLFSTMDPKGSSRSKADLLRIFSSTSENTKEMAPRMLNVLTAALSFANHEKTYRNISTVDQAGILLDNTKFAGWVYKLLGEDNLKKLDPPKKTRDVRYLMRMSVMAAMWKTWEKSAADATEFWEAIRDSCEDLKDSPRRILEKFLCSCKVSGREGEREVLVKSLQAWNAWRKGEDTMTLKYKEGTPTPEVV